MKPLQRTALALALAGALAIPATSLLAGEPPAADAQAAPQADTTPPPPPPPA